MASTDEFIAKRIKQNRRDLARQFQQLRDTVQLLTDGFDQEHPLDEQSGTFIDAADDLFSSVMRLLDTVTQLETLEAVPRVG